MADDILFERDGAIATLTINRPERRNPISDPAVVGALLAALDRLEAEPGVRVAILTGAGSAFSSGGDVRSMRVGEGLRDERPARSRRNYITGIQRLPLAFARLEIPVIAAVNGPAIGAGCDLACMCDARIAGESARFAESFVKLGLVPGDGGAWLLPQIVGFSRASEMALTGDMLDARQALAYGLVSQVVPDDQLPGAARALAERIAANPTVAVRLTKRLLWQSRELGLAAALELAASLQALAHTADDHGEAVQAFLEKRSAQFTDS